MVTGHTRLEVDYSERPPRGDHLVYSKRLPDEDNWLGPMWEFGYEVTDMSLVRRCARCGFLDEEFMG